MKDEYIRKADAVDSLKQRKREPWFLHKDLDWDNGVAEAISDIEDIKPADVVPVVRCKDCKHRHPDNWFCGIWGSITGENGYCNYGKRREE